MADKEKPCKECGLLNDPKNKECDNCGSNQFLDKYKGQVVVFDAENSEVASKLDIKSSGKFALKYG